MWDLQINTHLMRHVILGSGQSRLELVSARRSQTGRRTPMLLLPQTQHRWCCHHIVGREGYWRRQGSGGVREHIRDMVAIPMPGWCETVHRTTVPNGGASGNIQKGESTTICLHFSIDTRVRTGYGRWVTRHSFWSSSICFSCSATLASRSRQLVVPCPTHISVAYAPSRLYFLDQFAS